MAKKSKLEKAATPIQKILLETWCSIVEHSRATSKEPMNKSKLNEKLFPNNSAGGISRWQSGENIPDFEKLKEVAFYALANELIPEALNQSILEAYEDFSENPKDYENLIKLPYIIKLIKHLTLNKGWSQSLTDELNIKLKELDYFVSGPGDPGPGKKNPEFSAWIESYKSYFLACEEENIKEYFYILPIDLAANKIKGCTGTRPEEVPITEYQEARKYYDKGNPDGLIQRIRDDVVALMARINNLTNNEFTNGEIACQAGQPYSIGEFLATGEVIPSLSAYRQLEMMAGFTENLKCEKTEESPFSMTRAPGYMKFVETFGKRHG